MRPNPHPVAYVLRKFPVLSETFVLNELLELETQGTALQIFSLRCPNDPRFHEDLPRLRARITYVPRIEELSRLFRHHARLARQVPARYLRTLAYVVARLRPRILWHFLQAGYVANEIRRLGVRHLHAQFADHPTTVAALASRLTGIPFSFTGHAVDLYKAGVDRRELTRNAQAARFVVTVSEFNVGYLRQVAGPAVKILHIPNGIDLERFTPNGVPSRDPFRILSVARLVEKKGLSVLIEASGRLRDRGIEFRCDIVGKGSLRPRLESLIRALRLEDRVHLIGPASQLEVRDYYQASHLYVLPCVVASDGNRDGLPVSLVEALACGLPVISTPVTGIPEVVHHGHNGLVVPPGDAAALADAIARVMEDRAQYEALRAHARNSVAPRFDRRRTVAQLRALFLESIG